MGDFAKSLPTLKKTNSLFYGTFGQLTAKRLNFPIPDHLQSWNTFSPGLRNSHQAVSPPTTLPRLCVKCRGSKNASKLPDPFAQRSCLGTTWHRFNYKQNRGEICLPSIHDAHAPGEIYLCQLCGNITFHLAQKSAGKIDFFVLI